jgi:hypothetical protein
MINSVRRSGNSKESQLLTHLPYKWIRPQAPESSGIFAERCPRVLHRSVRARVTSKIVACELSSARAIFGLPGIAICCPNLGRLGSGSDLMYS